MFRLYLTLLVVAAVTPASAKVVTEAVPYSDGDVALEGFLAYDNRHVDPRPAVLVVHEWWGLNDFAKEQARRLAGLGYVAFAVDMYGRQKVTEDAGQAGQWARALYTNPETWRQRAKAGFDVVAAHPRVNKSRIAAIGFCFGGATVQQMAWSGLPMQGVVSFHGSLIPPGRAEAGAVRAQVLILHGAADTLVSDEDFNHFVQTLRKTDIDWQLVVYAGAKHSFTNPKSDGMGKDGVGYHERTAKRSWRQMCLFFADILEESRPLKPSGPRPPHQATSGL
jgi:dienelactone hydrolase